MGIFVRGIAASGAAVAAVSACLTPAAEAHGRALTRPPLVGYVLEGFTSKLDRLDLATNTMLRPIIVSRAPGAMAVAPGGRTAYVLTTYSSVWAVNLVTARATRVTGVGPYPYQVGFSAGGATAYVLTRRSLVAVDVATRKVLTRLPLVFYADGRILQVAPRGHLLFLINVATGAVTEVSTVTNAIVAQLAIGVREAGVFSPDGQQLYYAGPAGLVAVSTATGAIDGSVPVLHCAAPLVVAPGGKAIYVRGATAQYRAATVTRVNVTASGLSKAWTVAPGKLGSGWPMVLSPDGSILYTTTAFQKSITPIRTATGMAEPPIADHLFSGGQLVMGGSGRYLFAANFQTRAVAVISTVSRRLVRTIYRPGGFAFLIVPPGGRQVLVRIDPGYGSRVQGIMPISTTDGRPGRLIKTDGPPYGLVFAR